MALPPEKLETLLAQAAAENRLAHAYLLTGTDPEAMEQIFFRLAQQLLRTPPEGHPDLHLIKPESKSRRIGIAQIRNLERELHLKAFSAPLKVAGIFAADRMCLGQAEAANAFLKTLEEPPSHSVIFLLTTAPDLLLPTIKSRCIRVPLRFSESQGDPLPAGWLDDWLQTEKTPELTAYRRSARLSELWTTLRSDVEEAASSSTAEEEEDKMLEARAEAEFIRRRDEVLRAVIQGVWNRRETMGTTNASRTVEALEELRYALSRHLEAGLATERACLAMLKILR